MSLSSGCPWRQDSRGELSRVKSVASGCRGPRWWCLSRRSYPFYYKLNIPKLTDLYKIEISKLMYNIVHRSRYLPNNFSKYFEKACKILERSTRSTTQENDVLYISRFRSNRLQNSIRYLGVKIWNSVTHSIRLLSPIFFKVKLKTSCGIIWVLEFRIST